MGPLLDVGMVCAEVFLARFSPASAGYYDQAFGWRSLAENNDGSQAKYMIPLNLSKIWFDDHLFAVIEARAVALPAPYPIIDGITVADVEATLCAEPPNRELNPARKRDWKARVGLARVDAISKPGDDIDAAAARVTGWPVGMLKAESVQSAGPM